MRVIERRFSEFLRQPNDVVAELADHDVVPRRRNAPALRLSQGRRRECKQNTRHHERRQPPRTEMPPR